MTSQLDFTAQWIFRGVAAIWDNVDGVDDFVAGLLEGKRHRPVAAQDVRLERPTAQSNWLVPQLCWISA